MSEEPAKPPSKPRRDPPSHEELEAIIKASRAGMPLVSPIHPPGSSGDGNKLSLPPVRGPKLVKADERCWTRCRQSNIDRAIGKEPLCTSWCYISLRRRIASVTPVPNIPGAFIAEEHKEKTMPVLKPLPEEAEAHRWKWLDGRYVYRARGRDNVVKHLDEMKEDGMAVVENIAKRVEENAPDRRIKKAVGLQDDNYESITDLSYLWANSIFRFKTHILRIYSPAFRNLARLPETFTDGTQLRMLETVTAKLTDGSAFRLLERMGRSTIEVIKRIDEIRESRKSGGSGGGSTPPTPPLLPPLPGGGPLGGSTA